MHACQGCQSTLCLVDGSVPPLHVYNDLTMHCHAEQRNALIVIHLEILLLLIRSQLTVHYHCKSFH